MPGVSQTSLDNMAKYLGEGEIFVNVKIPADGSPMGWHTVAGVPLGNPTGGATSVGLTSGVAELTYKPDIKGSEVEQAFGEVVPHVTKEMVNLKFKCAESTMASIELALQTALDTTTAATTLNPAVEWADVGGALFITPQGLALVSPLPSGLYEWVLVYAAVSVSGLKLPYKRGEQRMVEVEVQGFADVTRSTGRQLFQIGQQTAPHT